MLFTLQQHEYGARHSNKRPYNITHLEFSDANQSTWELLAFNPRQNATVLFANRTQDHELSSVIPYV